MFVTPEICGKWAAVHPWFTDDVIRCHVIGVELIAIYRAQFQSRYNWASF